MTKMKYPDHFDSEKKTLVYSKESLMDDKEIFYQFDSKNGAAKKLFWNGNFKKIDQNKTVYMGQW